MRHLESAGLEAARRRAIEGLQRRATTDTPLPTSIHERLSEGARTLEAIERRRKKEHNPYIGLSVEHQILTRELGDLERTTLADAPGA